MHGNICFPHGKVLFVCYMTLFIQQSLNLFCFCFCTIKYCILFKLLLYNIN